MLPASSRVVHAHHHQISSEVLMKTRPGLFAVAGSSAVVALVALLVSAAGGASRGGDPLPAPPPDDGKLRIISLGAHPDDCEIRTGGVGALWSGLGHHVRFVSLTNGDIGHWKSAGGPLAQRRLGEVRRAAELLGVSTLVLDNHDGELLPTLENRRAVTRLIREWKADIVLGPRPNDYHPDHRYTGVLMQDSAYMVTVPFFCPDVPHLEIRDNPVFLFYWDRFERPYPFSPDVVVSIDAVIERKLDALLAMESQFYEGGANGYEGIVPADAAGQAKRRQDVRAGFARRFEEVAEKYRQKLIELYGAEAGQKVRYAEAFEVCEYGRQPEPGDLKILFPFFPAARQ
jgi:LmbE family N-acetylglucosaminyl deacetylase